MNYSARELLDWSGYLQFGLDRFWEEYLRRIEVLEANSKGVKMGNES